ncbi:MAG: ATP synthase F0 subunit B [Candidatus Hydrogenedentota bacterium]
MIVVNFTLLVQVGLFLLFMVVSHRYFLRPVLNVIDQREHTIEDEQTQAEKLQEEAERCEEHYARELASARRVAAHRIEEARRKALDERFDVIQRAKQESAARLEEARETQRERLAQERRRYQDIAPQIAQIIDARLRGGGPLN